MPRRCRLLSPDNAARASSPKQVARVAASYTNLNRLMRRITDSPCGVRMRSATPASFVMPNVKDQKRAEKSPAKVAWIFHEDAPQVHARFDVRACSPRSDWYTV